MSQSSLRVVIADDDEMALAIFRHVFASAGFHVELARDGREAIDRLRRHHCQLLLCDWEMPGMNGPELCRAVRACPDLCHVHIVLVTAHDDPDHRDAALAAGADAFAVKPFDPRTLIAQFQNQGNRAPGTGNRTEAIHPVPCALYPAP